MYRRTEEGMCTRLLPVLGNTCYNMTNMITYSAVCSHLFRVSFCCIVVLLFLLFFLSLTVHTPRRHATTHLSLFTIFLSLLSFLLTHEFHQHQIIILKNLDHLIFDVYLMHHLFDQFDLLLLNL